MFECDNASALHPVCDGNFVEACDARDLAYADNNTDGTSGSCGDITAAKWCCADITGGPSGEVGGVGCQDKKPSFFGICRKGRFLVNCAGSYTCGENASGGQDCTCVF